MPRRCDNCKITKSRSGFIKGRVVCKTCTIVYVDDVHSIADDDISVTDSGVMSTKSDEHVLENIVHVLATLSMKMDALSSRVGALETLSTKMDVLSSRIDMLESNINTRLDGITDKLQSCGTWTESIHESVNQIRMDVKHSQLQTDSVHKTVVAVINSKLDDTSCGML